MDDMKSAEKRAKAVVIINVVLAYFRLLSRFQLRIYEDPDQNDISVVLIITVPCVYCFVRLVFLNFIACVYLIDGVYRHDKVLCKRWIESYVVFYVVTFVIGPVFYCAIVGEPLLAFLEKEFVTERDWIPVIFFATADAIMVLVIVQFRDKVLTLRN